jgi:hypothetical protein
MGAPVGGTLVVQAFAPPPVNNEHATPRLLQHQRKPAAFALVCMRAARVFVALMVLLRRFTHLNVSSNVGSTRILQKTGMFKASAQAATIARTHSASSIKNAPYRPSRAHLCGTGEKERGEWGHRVEGETLCGSVSV